MTDREKAKAMIEKILHIYPITTQGWRHTEPLERLQGAIEKALQQERESAYVAQGMCQKSGMGIGMGEKTEENASH
jgi:hypothetical protein